MKLKNLSNFFLIILLLLTACEPKKTVRMDIANISQVWIDAPLAGSSLLLAEVEIVAHAANPDGVKAFEIDLNGQQLAITGPDPASIDSSLMYTRYAWQPAAPGSYLIEVKAFDQNNQPGSPAQVMVVIGEPETTTPTISATSTPADTATTMLTPTVEATSTVTPIPIPCHVATFRGDITVPDGTVFKPGETFRKTWRLENTGSCVWTTAYSIAFVSGDQLDAPGSLTLGNAVRPGESIDITVPMKAPERAGSFIGYWKLRNPQGQLFSFASGAALSVEIQVKEPPTAVPTFTATPQLGCTNRTAGAGVICVYPCPPGAVPGAPCKP